jgi:hypothetical protein
MRLRIVKLLLTTLLSAFVITAYKPFSETVQIQTPTLLSDFQIALWPEFDRPDVLVIYTFNLHASTSLPANITLRIPAAAGEPHAVAVGPSLPQVGDVPYSRQVVGDWAEITFVATTPAVQFEYYDPRLVKQGDIRNFEYRWHGEYSVDSMLMVVQQPFESLNMQISPNPGSGVRRADGLIYYTQELGSLVAGQTFDIAMAYEKTSDRLSAELIAVQPSQPLTPDTTGRFMSGGALPWIIAFLGLALIVGGGWWYWSSGQKAPQPPPKKRRRSSSRQEPESIAAEGSVYCHQCGKRAGSSDKFCRSCGARLRVE